MKVPFAHASEAEMSRILDFYGVRWEYEPDTFPILWNMDGDVIESFSPDFYLPDLDLYLEMTTLRQKLVRRKNRKLRRLRELYPDLNIKLFYARDFRELMLKYGKIALVQGLSGTSGQVAFPHAATDGFDGDGFDADGVERAAAVGEVGAVGVAGVVEPVVEPVVVAAAGPKAATGSRALRRRRRTADPRSVTEGPSIR